LYENQSPLTGTPKSRRFLTTRFTGTRCPGCGKIKIALESGQSAVTIFGHEYLLCLHEDINTALRDKEKGLPITDRYRFWRCYSFSKMMAFKVFGVIESEGVVGNITVCLFSEKPPLFFNMPSAYAGLKYGDEICIFKFNFSDWKTKFEKYVVARVMEGVIPPILPLLLL